MRNIKGDLFNTKAEALVITTNGFIKNNGSCVMGRGCAKRIQDFYPSISRDLGTLIRTNGNIVQVLPHPLIDPSSRKVIVISFPVKPSTRVCNDDKSNIVKHMQHAFKPGDSVPGWACVAELNLIEQSALQLETLVSNNGWNPIILPRPGCGAGELKYSDVEPILQSILDNRFHCITY